MSSLPLENLVFWDTEFSSLDPYRGELMSIGMVKPSGEELYVELEFNGVADAWVMENVVPKLTGPKVTREAAMKAISDFLGNSKPHMVAYVNQFDVIYLYKILGAKTSTKDYAFHWIHYDLATILATLGYDPECLTHNKLPDFAREHGLDVSWRREHHALDDAKLMKMVYDLLTKV